MSHIETLDSCSKKGYSNSDQLQEFKDRTQKLGEEIKDTEAKILRDAEEKEDRANRMRGMSLGIRLSSEMVASILVGTLIGYGLDYVFVTKPWFFMLFMIVGFIAGILNVMRGFRELEHEVKVHKGLDKKELSTNNAQ